MPPMRWLLLAVLLLWGLVWWGRRSLRGGPSPTVEGTEPSGPDPAYALDIGDELDLHGVPPREVDAIVDAFIDVAVQRRRTPIKIIHGKGTGRLRQRVRQRLARHPAVAGWTDAASPGSGWGATIVHLRRASELARDADAD
jgi:dsDNA-specific endonuclease/ATPase MutS2